MPAYLVMCASAAFAEEVVYRGFMVGYFLVGSEGGAGIPVTALLAPAVLFSLAHLYQGWQAVGKILLLSVLLAFIYIRSGSLWLVMAIHFAVDCVSGFASLLVIRRKAGGR
jgi:membrane protease YdiL (CAAX protease family)